MSISILLPKSFHYVFKDNKDNSRYESLNLNFVVIILDIDECEDLHPCHQLCFNTNGSYTCGCKSGFELTNAKDCIDIDECQRGRCSRCSNWPGSFKCSCDDGYRLNLTALNVCDSGYL